MRADHIVQNVKWTVTGYTLVETILCKRENQSSISLNLEFIL